MALDNLIEAVKSMDVRHSQAFGGTELDTWRGKVNHSEAFFTNLVNQLGRRAGNQTASSGNLPASSDQSAPKASLQAGAQEMKKASVNIQVDADIIATEGFGAIRCYNLYLLYMYVCIQIS